MNSKTQNQTYLEEIFPIEFIEDRKTISKNGSISLAFEIQNQPSSDLISKESYDGYHHLFCSALEILPPGTFVHKIDIFFEKPFVSDSYQKEFFTKRRLEHFHCRPILHQKSLFFISFNFKSIHFHPGQTFFSLQKKRFSNLLEDLDEKLELVESLGSQFSAIFAQLDNLILKRLEDEEILQFYYQFFNLDFSNIQDSGLKKPVVNDRNACIIGREYLNIISMIGQGSEVFSSMPGKNGVHAPFINSLLSDLPFPHIINQCIQVCDTESELNKLDTLRNLVQSFYRKGDQSFEIHESGLGELSESVRREGSGLVRFHLNVMVFDENPKEQSRKIDLIFARMNSLKGMKSMVENLDTTNLFFSMVGGNLTENFRWILMPLENAACYFHFTGKFKGDPNGFILCNRNKEPLYFNLWNSELDNKNKIVIGPSGSGKSFAINTLITQHYSDAEEVIILDIGGSYKGLFALLKGKYIEYKSGQAMSFNPFLIKKDSDGYFIPNQEKINFLVTLLIVLWKGDMYLLSKTEKALLARLILGFYEYFNKNQENSKKSEKYPIPTFNEFYKYLKNIQNSVEGINFPFDDLEYLDFKSLIIVLYDFTSMGPYSSLLNSESTNILSDHHLICFDLLGIKDDPSLFPIISLLIIEMVLDKFRDMPTQRKNIYMDEAWSMLKDALGDFVMNMFRTIRKSNGAISIITQGIDEIEKSPFGKAILQNTSTKIILDHSSAPQFYPQLQISLGLTEHEMTLLKSLRKNDQEGWRELFIKFGNQATVFLLEPCPEERIAFDSRIESREILKNYMEKYGPNLELAIDQLIEERGDCGTNK